MHNDVVIHQEEAKMLAFNAASVNTPARLNMRFGYFMSINIFVMAEQEMR
jgi:hypothetical protein